MINKCTLISNAKHVNRKNVKKINDWWMNEKSLSKKQLLVVRFTKIDKCMSACETVSLRMGCSMIKLRWWATNHNSSSKTKNILIKKKKQIRWFLKQIRFFVILPRLTIGNWRLHGRMFSWPWVTRCCISDPGQLRPSWFCRWKTSACYFLYLQQTNKHTHKQTDKM